MKVSVKKIDALRREMHFEVPKERVTKKTDEVFAEILKHAKLPGFRPGKAPRNLVEKAHGKTAREEMLKNLIPEVYQEGLKNEELNPIDFPAIDQVEFKDGAILFRASFDIRPEVRVHNYKGIKLSQKTALVTDEEVAKTLEFFKKGRGLDENVPADDALAQSMGFPTLEEFKTALKGNMEKDKDRQNRADLENQLIEELLKNGDCAVPQSLVERQLSGRQEEFIRRLKSYGAKDEDIVKKMEEAKKDLQAAAEKDVKIFLVLQKIGELENITAPQGENLTVNVMAFLMKEAKLEDGK